jgi:hypothetical protein
LLSPNLINYFIIKSCSTRQGDKKDEFKKNSLLRKKSREGTHEEKRCNPGKQELMLTQSRNEEMPVLILYLLLLICKFLNYFSGLGEKRI